jgi:Na+/proline symporter
MTEILTKHILTKPEGIITLSVYFVVMIILVSFLKRLDKNKTTFLVANRNVPWWMAAFSIAATWVWAPSMFVAAEKGYTQGIVGVFWFVVPNVLTLVLFGYFANWMRIKKPEGWTFSDYIREKFSNRTHNMYLVESFGLQTLSFAVQLLAGATIINKLTDLSFFWVSVVLAVIPLAYTFGKGLRASILTDYWQMIWIVIVLFIGLPLIFSKVEPYTIIQGFGGISGKFSDFFSKEGIAVTLSFGIPTTIGLLSGTFGDQMFWQRIFSVRQGEVKKAMFWAAFIFALVPISLSIFGFVAAGTGLNIADTQLVNVGTVIAYTPKWFLFIFLTMILSGLISTVDSIICAVSSIAGHDVSVRVYKNYSKRARSGKKTFRIQEWIVDHEIYVARVSMVLVTIVAILIANIPGLKILHLFLLYGTLRASVMLPTIFAILDIKMSERGLFYGLLTSICIGLPIFAYGNFNKLTPFILGGSLFTVLASGIIARVVKDKKAA